MRSGPNSRKEVFEENHVAIILQLVRAENMSDVIFVAELDNWNHAKLTACSSSRLFKNTNGLIAFWIKQRIRPQQVCEEALLVFWKFAQSWYCVNLR